MDGTRLSLLARVRDRSDDLAWSEFRNVYNPLLERYVSRRVRDLGLPWAKADVEEAVHDVFVRLWRRMPEFQLDHSIGRFRTYLWKVASNHVVDLVRRSRHGGDGRVLDEAQVDLSGVASVEPDAHWVRDFNETVLRAALEKLREETLAKNPNKWNSFERHWLEERPALDVAHELGITTALVYQNASRILRTLRERLKSEAFEDLLP